MEKRVIIFLILSLAILLGYEYLLRQVGLAPQPPQQEEQPAPVADAPQKPEPAPAPDQRVSPAAAPSVSSATQPKNTSSPSPEGERTIEVSNSLFRATISNRGGVVTNWELKKYRLKPEAESPPIQLVHQEGKFPRPLSLQASDTALSKRLNEGLYQVERDFDKLDAAHPVGHVTLTYQDSSIRVQKQLTFHFDSYLVDAKIATEGIIGTLDVGLGTNFGIVEWSEGFIGLIGPASRIDDKIEKDLPDTEQELKGNITWVALQDKYFLSVIIPTGASSAVIKKEGDKLASAQVRFPAPSASKPLSFQLYAGPKEFETLKFLQVGLEDTIDFGWFIFGSWSVVKAVAKPLFAVLRFFYEFTHNFGWAIILLTAIIKLLFVPLQYKSYKSMKEMQVIQPRVLAVQQKYKDDRDRLNRELIKLYKDHKVNPVGGCLPMLLQMPVFIALFNILYMTIDLRHAPFMLWVTDLSSPDPYYVLPILMGITMVIQQKITPTTMDPTQAKIMMLLPVFLTFLFLNFAAGLVLYWLMNNILTIGQQYVTDRYIYKHPTFTTTAES